jgi:hypothetical protein
MRPLVIWRLAAGWSTILTNAGELNVTPPMRHKRGAFFIIPASRDYPTARSAAIAVIDVMSETCNDGRVWVPKERRHGRRAGRRRRITSNAVPSFGNLVRRRVANEQAADEAAASATVAPYLDFKG